MINKVKKNQLKFVYCFSDNLSKLKIKTCSEYYYEMKEIVFEDGNKIVLSLGFKHFSDYYLYPIYYSSEKSYAYGPTKLKGNDVDYFTKSLKNFIQEIYHDFR